MGHFVRIYGLVMGFLFWGGFTGGNPDNINAFEWIVCLFWVTLLFVISFEIDGKKKNNDKK